MSQTSWKPRRLGSGTTCRERLRDERRRASRDRVVPARADECAVDARGRAPTGMAEPATRNIAAPDGIASPSPPACPRGRRGSRRGSDAPSPRRTPPRRWACCELAPLRRNVERVPLNLAGGEKVLERLDPAHVDLRRDRRRLVGEHERLHEVDPVLRDREAQRQQPLTQVRTGERTARSTTRTASRPATSCSNLLARGLPTSSSPTFDAGHRGPRRSLQDADPSVVEARRPITPSGSCVKRSGVSAYSLSDELVGDRERVVEDAIPSSSSSRVIVSGGQNMTTFQCVIR